MSSAEDEKYKEKRKHQRIHTRIEIPYWKYVKFENKGEVNIGFVKNMSKGGFFIETDISYERESKIGFEFYLPNSSKAVRGTAKIVWMSQAESEDPHEVPGMGLSFESFEGESEAILDQFIQQELAKR